MKISIKNIIILLIITALSASFVSVGAAGNSFSATSEELMFLEKMGVIGSVYNFNPDKIASREEAAEMICKMLGISQPTGSFSEMALTLGIMSGFGNGVLGEHEPVMFAQLMKMLVSAAGHGPTAMAVGDYPIGYLVTAGRLGITSKAVSMNDYEPVSLGQAAKLVYNTFHVQYLRTTGVSSGGDEAYFMQERSRSILNEVHKVYKINGIVTSNEQTALNSYTVNVKNHISINGELYKIFDSAYSELIGQAVTGYVKLDDSGENSVVHLKAQYEVERIFSSEVERVTGTELSYLRKDRIRAESVNYNAPDYIVNGLLDNATGFSVLSQIKDNYGVVTAIDNDDDGIIDVFAIVVYSIYVVDASSNLTLTERYPLYTVAHPYINLSGSDIKTRIRRDGRAIGLGELAAGEVVGIYQTTMNNDVWYFGEVIKTTVITGAIEAVVRHGQLSINGQPLMELVMIDGEEYRFGKDFLDYVILRKDISLLPAYNKVYQFIVDENNFIFALSTEEKSDAEVAYLADADLMTVGFSSNRAVWLFRNDNKLHQYTLDDDVLINSQKINKIKTKVELLERLSVKIVEREVDDNWNLISETTSSRLQQIVRFRLTEDGRIKSIDTSVDTVIIEANAAQTKYRHSMVYNPDSDIKMSRFMDIDNIETQYIADGRRFIQKNRMTNLYAYQALANADNFSIYKVPDPATSTVEELRNEKFYRIDDSYDVDSSGLACEFYDASVFNIVPTVLSFTALTNSYRSNYAVVDRISTVTTQDDGDMKALTLLIEGKEKKYYIEDEKLVKGVVTGDIVYVALNPPGTTIIGLKKVYSSVMDVTAKEIYDAGGVTNDMRAFWDNKLSDGELANSDIYFLQGVDAVQGYDTRAMISAAAGGYIKLIDRNNVEHGGFFLETHTSNLFNNTFVYRIYRDNGRVSVSLGSHSDVIVSQQAFFRAVYASAKDLFLLEGDFTN